MRTFSFFVLSGLALGGVSIAGIASGSTSIDWQTTVRILASHLMPHGWIDLSGVTEAEQVIVWLVRVPRVLVAACVGASLSVAGAQMQGLFRNPLASPDVLGCSSGGALGAVLSLVTGMAAASLFSLPAMAFAGALLALTFVYAIAMRRGRTPSNTLILAGIAVNALLSAATSFLITAHWVRVEVAQETLFWMMGGLDSRTWDHVFLSLPCLVLCLAGAFVHARDLDVLLLDEDSALSLGIEVEHVKRMVILNTAILTGGAVAVSGVIGFVGLIVPHVARLAIGPRHRILLPASALIGAIFLIVADIAARTLLRPTEIRLGIVTAVIGAPFFLYLLIRKNQSAVSG